MKVCLMNIRLKSVNFIGISIIIISILIIVFYPSSKKRKIDIVMDKKEVISRQNYDVMRENLNVIGMKLKSQELKKILIFYLNDKTGDEAFSWISDGFPSIINTFFSESYALEPIPMYSIDDLSEYIDYNIGDEIDFETAVNIGESMDADFIIQGDFYLEGDGIQFDVKIFNINNRELLKYIREKAEDKQAVFKAIHKISDYSLEVLNIDFQEKSEIEGIFTQSSEAFKLYQRGLWDFYQGRYSRSEVNFKRALDLDASFTMCYYYLGMIYRKRGIKSDFISIAYEKSIDLSNYYQKFIEAEYNFQQGRIQESIASMVSLQNVYNIDKQVSYHLAEYYNENGNYSESIELLNKILDTDPEYILALELKTEIMVKEGKSEEALEVISGIIKKRPFAVRLYLILAKIFLIDERYDFAAEQCRIAADIDEDCLESRIMLADILIYCLDTEGALDLLGQSQISKSDLPYYHSLIKEMTVMCFILSDNHEQALELVEGLIINNSTEFTEKVIARMVRVYLWIRMNLKDKALLELKALEDVVLNSSINAFALYSYLISEVRSNKEMHAWIINIGRFKRIRESSNMKAVLENEMVFFESGGDDGENKDYSIIDPENPDAKLLFIIRKMKKLLKEKSYDDAKDAVDDFFSIYSASSISLNNIIYYKELLSIADEMNISLQHNKMH